MLPAAPSVHFLYPNDEVMKGAAVDLTSESCTITFSDEDVWTIKFSEKNNILYMTIKDSNEKEVFYQESDKLCYLAGGNAGLHLM